MDAGSTVAAYGAQSMVDTLHDVLVSAPGEAFAAAFSDPSHGFRHPVADDVAVVEFARLPSGLYRLLEQRGVTMVGVPLEEVASLGCNVLTVRPGVVVLCEGNPQTVGLLEAHEIEVHTFPGAEICWNGSGGPTCLTRPLHRR